MSVVEWADTYGIHYWMILWSSYRNLTWGAFEPTTTDAGSRPLQAGSIVEKKLEKKDIRG